MAKKTDARRTPAGAPVPIKPTASESVVLWRRREHLNQLDAAMRENVSTETLRAWESGRVAPPPKELGPLAIYEQCFLLRRRSGKLQRDIAKELGCTRLWVIKMEDGTAPVDLLRSYWGL